MKISVVIPTITGREYSYAAMVAAYVERTPGHDLEIVTVKDRPSWPVGCNAGQLLASGEVLHFGADDLEPLEGWAGAMLSALEAGEIPAPQIWDYAREGLPVNQAQDGPPGALTPFSRVPSLTRAMAAAIGEWPDMHYYSDNWVSAKGRLCGFETRVTEGYAFIHHWHPVGRLDTGDWMGRYLPLYNAERAKLGLAPI
jgi:hypothetical protein